MSQPRRFTFSLLRMLLSMAAIAAVLAVGRWRDAPPAPIIVAAAAAGLLMFVIQWRHWPVLALEALCSLLGAGIASSCLAPKIRPPRTEDTGLTYSVFGALAGWFLAAWYMRGRFPIETDRVMRGAEPETDEIEVRCLEDPDRAAGDTGESSRRDAL